MFDIDNTLARHGSTKADPYAREVLSIARDKGFTCALVSNALTSRISQYAQDLEVDHLDQARKPSSKQIKAYLAQKGFDSQQVLLVGDQLFTDMWAGKSAGCQVALVKRRFSDEAPYVKVKRRLENSILKWFDHRINADWHR